MRTDILQQAQAIRASMDAAAIVLTDEQAAKAPRIYPTWAAGLAYVKTLPIHYAYQIRGSDYVHMDVA